MDHSLPFSDYQGAQGPGCHFGASYSEHVSVRRAYRLEQELAEGVFFRPGTKSLGLASS